MKNALRWGLLGVMAAAGCTMDSPAKQVLRYQFADAGPYRLDADFVGSTRVDKSHQGKVFARQHETLYVRKTFEVTVRGKPEGHWEAGFRLLRLRIHDQAGRFTLEVGPVAGRVTWYQEEETLQAYLGAEGYQRYTALMKEPLARLTIDAQGHPVPDSPAVMNQELVQLLGRNRVLGAWVAKSLRIPPVLSVVFPQVMVQSGDHWDYAGSTDLPLSGDSAAPLTQFHLGKLEADTAVVDYHSRLRFSGKELDDLGRGLQLEGLAQTTFKQGQYTVAGKTQFLPREGRPVSGRMTVEKTYSLRTAGEEWALSETEEHSFQLLPE